MNNLYCVIVFLLLSSCTHQQSHNLVQPIQKTTSEKEADVQGTPASQSFHLHDYTLAAAFFADAYDHVDNYNSKNYCHIKHEELNAYLSLIKSVIDQQVSQINISSSQDILTSKNFAQKCEQTCSCYLYEDIQTQIDQNNLKVDIATLTRLKSLHQLAEKKFLKQNNHICYKKIKSTFCNSDLFKQLNFLFKENKF